MSQSLAVLSLKKNEERRIRQGHLWVFSNEIDVKKTPLNQFEPGQQAVLESSQGKVLGLVYVNPHSLICARIISRDVKHPLSRSLIIHRINQALSLRQQFFDKPFYRLIFGDSDLLPGLVVYSFGDVLVVQITTAGMEQVKNEIIEALEKTLSPQAILLRNDTAMREMEQLPLYKEVVLGELPERVLVEENGVQFYTDVIEGQKTGWFYDHRVNRDYIKQLSDGKRVLDVFSYLGAWGLAAAAGGAKELMCVDASGHALDQLEENAKANQFANVITLQGDAFDALKQLKAEHEKFDIVVLDPPAFIKRKKDFKQGLQAYQRINQLALSLINRDGILMSASCSHHLSMDNLQQAVQQSARHGDRFVQRIYRGQQAPDHPVHPAIPETEYIKAMAFRVLPS